ncbi:PREDICTED: putative clathrin assembly protein At4g40080 [Tarenaya hassleriana]|uniref:putative clathrin assembly protein At4g40080 n=1 Tax=Tarenaya hassleriana TaxID=28532 RepID=UPI00053C6796|nr:PREDICTED: putative clathrin assembly protein At4g40080 [Tarenaya hassleriana]
MGKIASFSDLLGRIKDRASQSKAALVSNPKTLSFHLPVLRATTHDPSTPPHHSHVAAVLSAGNGSRVTAAAAVEAVMDRLHTTGDASVALKCLIIVHEVARHGGFILQDQLSVFPATGGRNYLKLSGFRDEKSPLMWELSYWVRWYALYLEQLLSSCRILGFFLSSTSSAAQRDDEDEKLSSLSNTDILGEIDALVCLLEVACKIPDLTLPQGKNLAEEITRFVGEDCISSIDKLFSRINEFRQRSSDIGFGDSVELVCALKRIESSREKLSGICCGKRVCVDGFFWDLVSEVKGMVGEFGMDYGQNGKMIVNVGKRGLARMGTQSARFSDRVIPGYVDSVRFNHQHFLL